MTPTSHVIASTLTSAVFFAVTHSWEGTAACFLSGIFIDIDHHFDLWIHKKKILWDIKHIYDFCEREKEGKLYLIFHSYELLAVFWLCLIFFHWNVVWWGLAVGLTVHIILDQIFNTTITPFTYFLWYRIQKKFTKELLFAPDFYTKEKGR